MSKPLQTGDAPAGEAWYVFPVAEVHNGGGAAVSVAVTFDVRLGTEVVAHGKSQAVEIAAGATVAVGTPDGIEVPAAQTWSIRSPTLYSVGAGVVASPGSSAVQGPRQRFKPISERCLSSAHARCGRALYLVAMLIGCVLVLAIRSYGRFASSGW